jgi:hypothetical protein
MIRTVALLVPLLVPLLAACNAGGERGVMWTDASEWDVRDGSAGCADLPGELCDGILEHRLRANGPTRNALTTDLRLPLGTCAARVNPATDEADPITGCAFTITAQDTRTAYRVEALYRSTSTTASAAARFVTVTWAITARWTEANTGLPRIVSGTFLTSAVFSPLR